MNKMTLPPETLKLLQDETMRLVQLVEDVLQQARADAAHGHLDIESMDMVSAVNTSLAPFGEAARGKGLDIGVTVSGDGTQVQADPYRMARVLRNLTDNAIRYAPADSELTIDIRADSSNLTVAYINKVEEIVTDDLPYLFERFYRGEKSRSREHGGAGIGLSIVKELVTAHDGTVGAELPDKNTIRIWFTLPKHPPISHNV